MKFIDIKNELMKFTDIIVAILNISWLLKIGLDLKTNFIHQSLFIQLFGHPSCRCTSNQLALFSD